MQEKKTKITNRKPKTTIKQVADFLTQTGFVLEMQIAEKLKKKNFKVKVNSYFFDYEENKKREIDIIAYKIINEVKVVLIIECKQSLTDDWVFVRSDKNPPRYYKYLKHLPEVSNIKEAKVLDKMHTFDRRIPIAQNFIARHASGKKSDSKDIDIYECAKKLPKIIVDKVFEELETKTQRTLIFPITVFSGQIFIAQYDNNLLVKELKNVQYATILDSKQYSYHYPDFSQSLYGFSSGQESKKDENSPVAETCRNLGEYYLIDFVSKNGFSSFLNNIEKRVSKIKLDLWPVEVPPKKGIGPN